MLKVTKNTFYLLILFFLTASLSCGKSADKNNINKNENVTVRLPAVAGSWYPADKNELSKAVDSYLDNNQPSIKINDKIVGIISPHAGYKYSAGVAASGYNLLKGESYSTVISVGLSHHYPLYDVSVCDVDYYRTPLGDVPVDREWIKNIRKKIPQIKYIPDAHKKEHSIEAQVALLQKVLKNFKMVEVLVSNASDTNFKILDKIFEDAYEKNYLIVVSTDLSHYHPYKTAVKMDHSTINYVLKGDPVGLITGMQQGSCEACGYTGLIGITAFIRSHNLKPYLVQYKNSGDVTGDISKGVVGYSSIIITEPKKEKNTMEPKLEQIKILSEDEENNLLNIARTTLKEWVFNKKTYKPPIPESEVLKKDGAAFVTLTENSRLRGCIGNIIPVKPLYICVRDNAINAASNDYRFRPVSKKEYDKIDIEISVMSPLVKVNNISEIKVGRDGLILKKGMHQGVFLPQVPVEWNWNLTTYLEELCGKAGLSDKNAWKDRDTELYKFSAQVFGEKDK